MIFIQITACANFQKKHQQYCDIAIEESDYMYLGIP